MVALCSVGPSGPKKSDPRQRFGFSAYKHNVIIERPGDAWSRKFAAGKRPEHAAHAALHSTHTTVWSER